MRNCCGYKQVGSKLKMGPIDINDTIRKPKPDFIARVQYLTSEQGGRTGYAATGYRPAFKIPEKKEMTSAEQKFIGTDRVEPGEEVLTEIRILWIEAFQEQLEAGTKFELREGDRIVAIGEIQEVRNEKLKKK